jgi:hypothetical protein
MTKKNVVLLCLLPLFYGCSLERILLDGTIAGTRRASASFDTLTDLEVAKLGAGSSLATLEGYYALAPDNQDNLFMLMTAWSGYAGAFIEDSWERAQDSGDEATEDAEAQRARQAYDRAIKYGSELLERKKPGFKDAMKNSGTINVYLQGFEKADASTLLWFGVAWLSRGGVAAADPEIVSELFVGVAFLERSMALDPNLNWGLSSAVLGAYHSRSPDAELKQAKDLFELSLTSFNRKALTTRVLYAANYACNAHDAKLYKSLLEEVLNAGDTLPEQRLENTLAKRKAQRYLGKARLARCGF